jgi:hypothetical protein
VLTKGCKSNGGRFCPIIGVPLGVPSQTSTSVPSSIKPPNKSSVLSDEAELVGMDIFKFSIEVD